MCTIRGSNKTMINIFFVFISSFGITINNTFPIEEIVLNKIFPHFP